MSTNLQHLELLIQELGPATAALSSIAQEEPGAWSLAFDDGTVLMLEWSEPTERLHLLAPLGIAPASRASEVWRLLLSFNLLRAEQGDMTMALAGEEAEAMLQGSVALADLQLPQLQSALQHFAEQARRWRSFVCAPASEPAAATPPQLLDTRA